MSSVPKPYSVPNSYMKIGGKKTRKYRKKYGGYSSASSYGMYVNGPSTEAQFSRTFDVQGPYGKIPGGTIIGAQGQNIPNLSLKGGKKRKTKKHRKFKNSCRRRR